MKCVAAGVMSENYRRELGWCVSVGTLPIAAVVQKDKNRQLGIHRQFLLSSAPCIMWHCIPSAPQSMPPCLNARLVLIL